MGFLTWSKSEIQYGRKVFHSGLEGVCSAWEHLPRANSLTAASGSLTNAVRPAALAACIGALCSSLGTHRKAAGRLPEGRLPEGRLAAGRTFAFALLGGVLGFGAGLVWKNRRRLAGAARSAMRNIQRVRDEHWLERHPIDYA